MARPWSQSNDFRIAIAMKVALKATPGASAGPFRRHRPRACRIWAGGPKESRWNSCSSDKQTTWAGASGSSLPVRRPELIARRSLSRFYSAWPSFASKSYPPLSFYSVSQFFEGRKWPFTTSQELEPRARRWRRARSTAQTWRTSSRERGRAPL